MQNIYCSLGNQKTGYFTSKFDLSTGWEDQVRSWVRGFGQPGMVLKMHKSDDSGYVYRATPDRTIEI